MCNNSKAETADLKSVGTLPEDDVDQRSDAHASPPTEVATKNDDEIPPKKRKTRRGKNKRRHPYDRKATKVIKPEAPYNSNRFLIEDHGNIEELDEKLKKGDALVRTRDSSFSMDSDGEFYSSPDDEEEFLIRDFDDQYEILQAERLNNMSKTDLIAEYLQLEKKVEILSKRAKGKSASSLEQDVKSVDVSNEIDLKVQIDRLRLENETLKQELLRLKGKLSINMSDSEDSESDSSVSCSSCSSSDSSMANKSRSSTPVQNGNADYTKMNGLSPTVPA
ncbi:protein HEXIM-like [Agrilus planipennis]|uniref:Protein HEXIM-like n=1 Tax=Agrilus planipennis TaxID=224129 RepID=A0A1W4WXM7_AGRPL|nr:protein HEXIM-like [Agrilus planipennis]